MINSSTGSGAEIGDAALASPHLAGVHFTGSTGVFQGMWETVGANIAPYRNYPRIVGETGGKDFIVAHASADVDGARDGDRARRLRVPGTEVLGRVPRCSSPTTSGRSCATGSPREIDGCRSATSATSATSWAR